MGSNARKSCSSRGRQQDKTTEACTRLSYGDSMELLCIFSPMTSVDIAPYMPVKQGCRASGAALNQPLIEVFISQPRISSYRLFHIGFNP